MKSQTLSLFCILMQNLSFFSKQNAFKTKMNIQNCYIFKLYKYVINLRIVFINKSEFFKKILKF